MKTKTLYLDLETGGDSPSLHSILSIAVRDKQTDKTTSILIKPQDNKCIEQEALDYNGIDLEKNIKEGVKLRQAINDLYFEHFIFKNEVPKIIYFIGWKVRFDFEFIKQAFKEEGTHFLIPPVVLIDLKKLSQAKYEDFFKKMPYVTQYIFYLHIFNENPRIREDKALTDIDMSQRIDLALDECEK